MIIMRLSNVVTIAKYLILSSRNWIYAAIGFTLMFPLLWLVLLRIVGNPQYFAYFIAGTVVNTSFLIPFIGTAQDIAYLRRGSTIYSLLLSNGADHWDIVLGYLTQLLLYSIPSIISLLVLSIVVMGMYYGLIQLLAATIVSLVIAVSSALLGYALGIGVRNWRIVNQVSQVIPWPLLLLAPVYYPITILPESLRYVSLALPTTYMAFAINGALNLNITYLTRGLLGILLYSLASVLIVKYAIIKGEVNG